MQQARALTPQTPHTHRLQLLLSPALSIRGLRAARHIAVVTSLLRQAGARPTCVLGREFFIDNLLVRIHFIIVMITWTGLAPWEVEFPFSGSLTPCFLQVRAFTPQTPHRERERAGG